MYICVSRNYFLTWDAWGIIKGAPSRCRTQGLLVTGQNQDMDGKKLRWGTKITSLQRDDAGGTERARKEGPEREEDV